MAEITSVYALATHKVFNISFTRSSVNNNPKIS